MSRQVFHFTLGPVQGFVAQARRTRDFWAGSFLLSWLSGVAMAATQRLGGSVEFPLPPGDYLERITGAKRGEGGPRQGAIPNRFKARVSVDFDAAAVAAAVRGAWQALAEEVWRNDLAPHLADATERQRVHTVWQRQHANFWEITWVLADEAEDAPNLLDRRKNWRRHLPPEEPGVKCMIMEGWQELSGISEMKKPDNEQRRAFWDNLRKEIRSGETDLNEKEMLCGLAFVKRRFSRHFHKLNQSIALNAAVSLPLRGWELQPNMPSVSYMAAVHWLKELMDNFDSGELKKLHQAAKDTGAQCDEWDTHIQCLEECLERKRAKGISIERRLLAYDGNLFFDHTLQAPGRYGLKKAETAEFARLLRRFRESKPEFAKAPLSPFYAVLVMDGDSLGANLGTLGNPPKIAAALNDFTDAAKTAVEDNNGVLIYAGGDDVLALLPLEDALDCALKLRERYSQAFQDKAPGIATSLSGAVIYAHVKTALGEVLRQAHSVLDEVAKDGAGRDAIAVRVLKPGGEHLSWAQPWDIAIPNGDFVLPRLAREFAEATKGGDGQRFSGKFFHRMRERFEILADRDEAPSPRRKDIEMATQVLVADYLASHRSHAPRGNAALDALRPETAEAGIVSESAEGNATRSVAGCAPTRSVGAMALEFIAPLLDQCCPVQRQPELPPAQWQRKAPNADAALLVRFLAQKGVEGR